MSGYREHSYDPNAGSVHGRPLRPFNWVQWTGVGLMGAAGVLLLTVLASAAGFLSPRFEHNAGLAAMLSIVGATLINSRREEVYDPAPELAPARKRWMIITVAICVAILSAALAFEFAGGAG